MNAENTQKQENAEDVVAYKDMSWQKLKSLMTAEGQEWVDKDHAVEYLTKLDADDDSKDADVTDAAEEDSSEEVDASDDLDPEEDLDTENSGPDGTDESTDAVTDVVTDSEADAQANADDVVTDEADEVVDDEALVTDPEDDIPCFNPDDKHGVISGQCNARYWQNDCHYDSQGEYIAPEDVVVTTEEAD